ncbi:PKD domain-containing protein [Labilibacter sediminis]|nr:PKD domain-containing protein [Labilibacter sediminis]
MIKLYTHTLNVISFKRMFMRLCFFIFLFLGVSNLSIAQSNVEVCRDGVIRLANQLKDPTFMGANSAPPGHLQKGYWSNIPAPLVASNINDPNAIFSGFDLIAPGTTFTLTWYHGIGQTYDITVEVTNAISPEYELHNEDGNTANVLFCTTPGKYDFTVVPAPINPGASIIGVEYMIYHADGTTGEISPAGNPTESVNLNAASIGYQDLDVFHALVSNGTCLDITTNTIQLAEISSVVVQIQGGKSACDPTVFDGSHVLEVLPYDPNNFDYQWQLNGVNIAGATSATYTLVDPAPGFATGSGAYTVIVNEKSNNCGPFTTPAVTVSSISLPEVAIVDNPLNSGTFEICEGAVNVPLNTTLTGGTVPAVADYDWYQNGTLVTGNNSTYFLQNDVTDADADGAVDDPNFNAFGDYYVVYKDANNVECKSTSLPISVVSTRIDAVSMIKANNATPFCGSGTPQVAITVTGGTAPYSLTFSNGYIANLPVNGAIISLPPIVATTTFDLVSVQSATGCTWTGSASQTFNVLIAPNSYVLQDASGNNSVISCTGNSVGLWLSGSDANVNYQVYDSGNNPIGGVVPGTGAVGVFDLGISVNNAETYHVIGTSTITGCQTTMGSMVVSFVTPPVGTIVAGQAFEKCEGTGTVFGVTIDITPTNQGPWDLVINDGSNDYNFTANTSTDTWTTPNVATTKTFTIKSIEDRNGCVNTTTNAGSVTITVNPTPNITLAGPDDVCINGGAINITANITPGGTVINRYTWSTGAVDDGKQTISATPITQPVHSYSVEVESDKGCIGTQIKNITVNSLPLVTFDSDGSKYIFCMDDASVNLTGNPLGGKFYVDGVELATSTFNPSLYVQGDHDVTYIYQDANGCENFQTRVFTVNAIPNVTLTGLNNQYCTNAGTVTMNGNPDGSGGGIPGIFSSNPSNALYFTDNNDGTADFNVGAAVAVQGSGNYIFTYVYTNNEGCDATASFTTTVLDDLNANLSFTGLPALLCESAAPVTLTPFNSGVQLVPAAGTTISFTGPAGSLSDNGDGTFDFDPSVAGAGNHTITLNYSDVNGCSGSTSNSIQIGTPISVPGLGNAYCSSDAGPYNLLGSIDGNAPVPNDGTTFDIIAPGNVNVALNQANGSYDFIPSTLYGAYGDGVYTVIYKYTDGTGCQNTVTSNIQIIEELNAIFTIEGDAYATAQANYCENDALVDLDGHADLATASGTVSSVFTGNGVSGNGIAGGFFNPQDASVKLHPTANTITHTVIHTINGVSCPSPVEEFDVFVVPVQVAISGLSGTNIYCTNSGTSVITVSGADAAGGTAVFKATKNGNASGFLKDNNNNTATIDPSVGSGIYEITLEFTKTADGCKKTIVETVEVYADNPVTFSGFSDDDKICQSSDPITLRGDMFAGGAGNFIEITPGLSNSGTDDLGNAVVADDGVAILTPGDLPLGIHTITYEFVNANGCVNTAVKKVEIVGTPTDTYSVVGGGAYCFDDAPQGVTIGLSGSNSGVTYELLFGGASLSTPVTQVSTGGAFNFESAGLDILFTTEGIYTVKAKLGGCDAMMSGSVLVEEYELVLEEDSRDEITCNGADNGSVTLKASGGSGAYEFSKNGSDATPTWQASPTFAGLAPGDHDFSVRDLSAAACEAIDVLTVTIAAEPSAITVSETNNINVGCTPCTTGTDCEGSATIQISGGTPFTDLASYPSGYDITWPASVAAAQLSSDKLTANLLSVGTYSVLVEDAEGCSTTFDVTITENAALELVELDPVANHVDNICKDGTEGEFVVQANGGSGEYQFSIDGGSNYLNSNQVNTEEYKFINLGAGDYTIIVRDKNNPRCTFTIATDVTIAEPLAGVSLTQFANNAATCYNRADGNFTVEASGGNGTYEFSEVNPAIAAPADWKSNGTNQYTISGLLAGDYTVWVRDADPVAIASSCDVATIVVTVTQPVQLSFNDPVVTNVSCNSGNNGVVELTGVGGSGNYVYSVDGGLNWQPSNIFDGLDVVSGPYSFSIAEATDATCNNIDVRTVTITEPADFIVSEVVASHKDVSCNGGGDAEFEVTTAGGVGPFEYRLHGGTAYITAWDANNKFAGYPVGTYEVSVRDLGTVDPDFCEKDRVLSIVITQPAAGLSLTAESVSDVTCNGGNDGSISITVAGGTTPYNYQWKDVATNTNVADLDGGKTNNPTNLSAGDYEVTVTDDNNCSFSKVYTVNEAAALNLVTDNIVDVTCNGESSGVITLIASGGSGTYSFNVDGSGWTVNQAATTFKASDLAAGDHSIWVSDPLSSATCEYRLHPLVTVNQEDVLELQVTDFTNVSCFEEEDGSIEVTAKGGSGNYDYYIDDEGWVAGTGAVKTFSLKGAATYTLQVRDQNDVSCATTITHELTQPGDFTTTASATHVKCFGESTGSLTFETLGGVGPFEYRIDGVNWKSSPITGLSAGSYSVDVRDLGTATNCTKINQVSVVEATIEQPTAGISIGTEWITDVVCYGESNGTIDLQGNVSGGTVAGDHDYTWFKKTPDPNDADLIQGQGNGLDNIIGLSEGTYYVVVVDDEGCSIPSADYEVQQPNDWNVDFTPVNLTKYNGADGIINVHTHTGSNTGHTIKWFEVDNGAETALSPLYDDVWLVNTFEAGTYRFKIKDDKNCEYVSSDITLTQPEEFVVSDPNILKKDVTCYGYSNGEITIEVISGSDNYTFDVVGVLENGDPNFTDNETNVAEKTIIWKNLKAGQYTINVTDNTLNETKTFVVDITQLNELVINPLSAISPTCHDGTDGSIQVEITGHAIDAENSTITWTRSNPLGWSVSGPVDDGTTDLRSQTGLKGGTYTVNVVSEKGCTVTSDPIELINPTAITATETITPVSINGGTDGRIYIDNINSVNAVTSIEWYKLDGAGTFVATGVTGVDNPNISWGTYRYIITDDKGCTFTSDNLLVSEPGQPLDVEVTKTPITCYGDATGIITVDIQTGVAPFSVTLTGVHDDGTAFAGDSSTDSYTDFTDLKAGVYQVVVVDDEGQTFTENNIIITENDETIVSITPTQIPCNGGVGQLAVSLSGYTDGSESWQILDPNLGEVYNGAIAGNDTKTIFLQGEYNVTVYNQDGCPVSEKLTITEPEPFVIEYSTDSVSIYDFNDGTIDVHTYSGSNGAPYTISWVDNGVPSTSTDFLRTDLVAGTYDFTIKDANGCDTTITGIKIGQPHPLNATVKAYPAVCFGDENGRIEINFANPHNGGLRYRVTGKAGTYDSGDIYTKANSNTISGLGAGIYIVNAYDTLGTHFLKDNIEITEQEVEVSLVATPQDITCYGEQDGSISIALAGRVAEATDMVTWSGSNLSFEKNDIISYDKMEDIATAEDFVISLKTAAGCVDTVRVSVNEPEEIVIQVTQIDLVTCSNGNDGAIYTTVTGRPGGFTYNWYKHDGSTYQPHDLNGSASLVGQQSGTYKLNVISLSDGCTAELQDIKIGEGGSIEITTSIEDVKTCAGDNTGKITVKVAGGNPGYIVNCSGQEQQTGDGAKDFEFDNLVAGSYVIEVTDSRGINCATSTTVTVEEPTAFDVNMIGHDIDCDPTSATSGTLSFSISGGVEIGTEHKYQIKLPLAGFAKPVTINAGATHTENLSDLTAGAYNLIVENLDENGNIACIIEYPFTLEHIVIDADAVVPTTCKGINDGQITGVSVEGTSDNYTYAWTSPDGGVGLVDGTLDQSGLSPGTYVLTVTDIDRGNCEVSKTFVVGIDSDNLFTISSSIADVSCNGEDNGSITLMVDGNIPDPTFAWSGPNGFISTEQSPDSLNSGNYVLHFETVINGKTCGLDTAFTVSQPNPITYTAGFEYTSCDPYERTLVLNDVKGGVGTYNYLWDGPTFDPAVPADPTSVKIYEGGVYTITVQDDNNCEVSRSLTVPLELSVDTTINHISCNGAEDGSIIIDKIIGGSGIYDFTWTTTSGHVFADNKQLNQEKLRAGVYTLRIKDQIENDGAACYREYTWTVKQPEVVVVNPTVTNVSCFGLSDGSIVLNETLGGTAPYTYNWSPVIGDNEADSKNQDELRADIYTVTVTDANGCKEVTNIEVEEPAEIVLSTVVTETICDGTGGAIDLTVAGGSGAGFTYEWSSALGTGLSPTDEDQTGLGGGTYTVVVKDKQPGSTCTATISETLTHAISIINENITPVTCSGNDDGSISYDVIGGDGDYTYTWNTISGDASRIEADVRDQSGLSEGEYEVTITDGRTDATGENCSMTKTFTVVASTGLSVNVSVSNAKLCFGEPGGKLKASVTGGSGTYKYYWNGVEGVDSIYNQTQGIYGLRVEDVVLGCTFEQSYEIKGPAAPISIDQVDLTHVLCFGEATGEIAITVSGGTIASGSNYVYTWKEGTSTALGSNPTKLLAGTYSVTVTDDNGCSVDTTVIVTEPDTHVVLSNPVIVNATTVGGTNGQITVDVNGGVAPYSYQWYNGADNPIGPDDREITGIGADTYRVIVTDANGCTFELTGLTVTDPDTSLGFNRTVNHIAPCNGDDNGMIEITSIYGGVAFGGVNYRIQITGPGVNVDEYNTTYKLEDLTEGDYVVVITDEGGETSTETITIENPTPLTLVTAKVSDVQCYGTNTGEIEVTVYGGKPDASGNYFVTLESVERGLVDTKDDAKAGTKFFFENIPAGNYTVTVYDHAEDYDNRITEGCSTSEFTLITEPSALVDLTSVGGVSEICNGDSYDLSLTTSNWDFGTQGSLKVTVYDDFEYTEHTVDQSPYVFTETPASGRTYQITKVYLPGNATCLQGESTGNQVLLTVHDLPTANITGPTEVCEDGSVQLNVKFTGMPPFSFTWQDANNSTSNTLSGINGFDTTFIDSPAAAALYQVIDVSDANSCNNSGNGEVEVKINNKPDVALTGSADICAGDDTNLSIKFKDGVSPFTITYDANGKEGTLAVSPNGPGNTYIWNVAPDSVTTVYTITSVVDANGCSMDIPVPIQAFVTVKPLPGLLSVINSTKDDGGICQGTTGIDYTVEGIDNATEYLWSVDAGMNIITGDGTTGVVVDFDRDFTGGYIRVYAKNECGVSPTIERWVNAIPLPSAISAPTGDQNLCEGETGIIYRVNPVDNASSYEWSVPAGLLIQGDDTGTSIVVDLDPNVPSTVGEIYVRPVNSCSNDEPWSDPLEVTVTPLPVAYAGPDDRVCVTTYTLNADPLNANEEGEWTIIKGAGQYTNRPVDQIRRNASIYNLSQGENTFVWTVTNTITGCYTSDTVTIHNDMLTVNASVESSPVCDGQATLMGTPVATLDNADEGYWTIISGGGNIAESEKDKTTISGLNVGENILRWTIRKNACESYAEVTVLNNQATEARIYNAVGDEIVLEDLPCQTNSTSIQGSMPEAFEKGYWRVESGSVTIDNVDSPNINITNIAKGDHVLSWNILNGACLSQKLVTIRNNALDVFAGIDKYTCDGTVQLNGTDYDTSDVIGEWSIKDNVGVGVFDDANNPNTTVTGLSQLNGGRNVFIWTLMRNGCVSADSVVITNSQTSQAEIAGGRSTMEICRYDTILHAVAPVYGIGVWSVVGGQGKFEDPADPNTRVSNIAHGENIYRWTVTNNTCSSSVDFTVTNLHVDAYAGADTAVCGKVAELRATPAPQGANGLWSVVEGDGGGIFNPSSTNPTASITSLGYGKNVLAWTVEQNGCSSSDTVVIYNNKPYEVNAAPYTYTDAPEVTLRADIPTVGYGVWTLLEGRGDIANPNSATTEVTNLLPNFNYFRWTVSNAGCVEYVDIAVQSGVLADADAGLDQLNLCEDFTSLQANEPEGTYGEWTTKTGSATFENSNSAKTEITNISPGRNVFIWTLRFAGGSANSKQDTVVIINNKPSTAIAGIDRVECGETTTLNAREPEYGVPTWSILSGGGVFADINNPKTPVSGLAKGENIFKYEVENNGCFSFDTISVFNHEPSDAYAGEDLVVCADSAELNPEIPKHGVGNWRVLKGSGKGRDASGNETDEIGMGYVYDLAPGENILVWEVLVPGADPKCIKSDSLVIQNNAPSISFAGHNRSICMDSVNLSGSIPLYGEGTWTLISGSGEIEDPLNSNTLVRGLGKGKNRFRWTIDNNGCTSITDVEISNNLIEAFGGYDQVLCTDTAVLEGNNPAPGVGTWGILGGSGSANFDDNESPYTNVRELDKGENILTWTINYQGCQSVSQVKITNNEPSVAFAGDNKATCDNSIMLGASKPEVGNGLWTIRTGGGKFVDDQNEASRVDSLKFGDNVFRWTVENEGCVSYDDVQISFNTIEAQVAGTQEICSDRTFLEANSPLPGTGTWSVIGGASQAKFVNSHDPVSEVYDLAKGTNRLRWTINNKGCITYKEVEVINHSPSTAYAGNTQELCVDNTILDATPVDIGTGQWEVLTGAAVIPTGEELKPKASITGLSKGENVFRWTVTSDNGLCTSVDNVVVINNEPSEPYAGADEEYCSPTVVLKAAAPDFGTGNWSIIEGGGNFNDQSLPNATISNLNEGVNTLRWTITQGQCTKTSDIVITNNTPTTANAGPDIEDCKNYAFLDANEATQGEGYWTLISGNATFEDENDAKTKVEGLTFGRNILMWNITKGSCISSDSITVFNQIPSQADAGTNKETCEDYLTLNANNPTWGDGKWTVISGNGEFDNDTIATTIVRNLGLGENRFKWTVAYGECTTEDVVEVISNKADPYAGEDDISYESSYELKASNPGDLGAKWTVIAGNGSFRDETFFNTVVDDLNEGINTFRWQMDVNGCITYDDVSIEYRVVPDAGFIADTTQGCYPLRIQFTNYSTGGSEYSWDFGDGQSSTARNPVHTFADPGEYVVTLTAPGPDNVDGVYQKTITVHDHPIADFSYGPDVVYVPGDELRCSSMSTDAVKYLWEFGDGATSTAVNPVHEYSEEGVYYITLTVESEHGCFDDKTSDNSVEAILQGFVKFPNAFTPRSDGLVESTIGGGETNTVFRPVYKDVDEYQLQIFNRWGQLIYESKDIEEGWNGFFNGQLSPQAVYVWKAKGRFVSGKEFNEAGSVLLVR